MSIILDTCTFLWILGAFKDLSKNAIKTYNNAEKVYVSVVSFWEILIKYKKGTLILHKNPYPYLLDQCQLNSLKILHLKETDIFHLLSIPNIHNDPFDRMIICQSINHSMPILTPDTLIKQYKQAQTIW